MDKHYGKNSKGQDILISVLVHLQILFMCVVVLVPILWIIGSAFGNTTSIAQSKIIPDNPTLANFDRLFQGTRYTAWYLNTFKIAVATTIFSVLISTMTAYIFSRFKFRGKKIGLMSILVVQIFPSFLGMTAIYMLFFNAGLLDNIYALVLVYVAGRIPMDVWLMKGYLQNIPMSLDEAAMIDGASRMRTFFTVILPLSVPMVTFLAVTAFMSPWMDFIFPRLLLTSDSNKTLAIGLWELVNGQANNDFTAFAAGAILVAIPITILYMSLQKYLISGITAGATKE